jgi:transposase
LGLPVAVVLSCGEASDMKGYVPVMDEPGPAPKVLIADKGYDSDAIINDLAKRGIEAVIPAKRNRKQPRVIDGFVYALRNIVERCFSKLKHSRRLATRYDKTTESYLGFVLIASARLWIRHFVNTAYNVYKEGPLKPTPSPVLVRRFTGSGGWHATCSGILGLTKMDWNNNTLYKKLPVTLVYSKAFADIIQQNQEMTDNVFDFRFFI